MRQRATADLRRANRSEVLRLLLSDGPLSRSLLGELTGLSAACVATIVGELLAEGLLVQAGTEGSDGGRPRVRMTVNPAFGTNQLMAASVVVSVPVVGGFLLLQRYLVRGLTAGAVK